jgi:NAD(P)-dependent dehydrogenase (short-subunit alcohol dehydrogenase family)
MGRAISLLFASEGASVVAAGRRSEPLQETVREIRRQGGVGTFTRGDVSRSEKVELMVQAATYNFGGLDILVNGAGINMQGSILKTEERRWDKIMSVNLKGPYLVSRHAVPAMRERGGGSIVNIAGTAGLVGRKEAAAFSASKGGLLALTRSMALDHAPDAIRVNAICPGPVRPRAAGEEGYRAGRQEGVAQLALYLASDESSWVTGSYFTVDGGLLEGRDGG